MIIKYQIIEEDIVKEFLRKQNISRNLGKKIKLYGKIYINGILAKNYSKLHPKDELIIEYHEEVNEKIKPSLIKIDIVYEDEYLIILSKPKNLSTQPSRKHFEDNLISRIKAYFQEKQINSNVHIVNRLDYSTSGLSIIAKEGYIHHLLNQTNIEKKYLALCEGIIKEEDGVITQPITKELNHNIKRKICDSGQVAITVFKVVERYKDQTLLELSLKTGRCHQIRLHLSDINHPVIGDKLYGNSGDELFLHSYYIKFIHPITNKPIEIVNYPDWYIKIT